MTHSLILINEMSFNLTAEKAIFSQLNLAFSKQKTGLIGKNGIGKSTLLKLILEEFLPHSGSIHVIGKLAYVPQNPLFLPDITIASLLGFEEKICALHRILQGSIAEHDFFILNDVWDIEERLHKQLEKFGLSSLSHQRQLNTLSCGEMTRLLLTKAFNSNSNFLLLDEPTNHLDSTARQQLYEAIKQWQGGLLVISHDRELLNLMDEIVELNTLGASRYGGNYDAYFQQKSIEKAAKEQQLQDAKKLMQKTKITTQASREKHEQKQSYGKELKRSGSIDKIGANSKKGRSERTQSKLLIKKERLFNHAETKLKSAKESVEIIDKIHISIPKTYVPSGKVIVEIEELNFFYESTESATIHDFSLKILGPERIALNGNNGSGKTTLIKLILKELQQQSGKIYIGADRVSYLDQNASLLNPNVSIIENFLCLNPDSKEYDAYLHLAEFLFKNTSALKLVKNLSGGEKLRAALACTLM